VRLLFDQGTPAPLRNHLPGHQVSTAYEMGWGNLTLKNGELLEQAQNHGFEVLIATDQNLKYQQNLSKRQIAILVLSSTSWPRIQKVVAGIVAAISSIQRSDYLEIRVP
jgi:hypothetical protein